MRFSIRRLIHLVALVVLVQMVIYLWTMKKPHKVVMPVVLLEKQVRPEKKTEGTCNYELCPKVKKGVLNVHMIAHSHIDVGWTHTVDEFYTGAAVATSCVKCILELTIKELVKNPERRYIFIEMKYLTRYWEEINEAEKDLLRQLIKERRLELVGGGWVMSDAGVTLYNDIIDQHTLGFDFINENFGPCAQPRTAWHVDLFGYSREHAAILSKMGYDSLLISRVDFQDIAERKKSQNMEFIWSTSGQNTKENRNTLFTSILYDGYYAPEGYTMDKAYVAPEVTKEIVDKFVNLMKTWSKSYKSNHVVVPMGADFAYRNAETWFNFYDPLIKKANEMYPDVHLMYSTPSCYSYNVNKENVTLDVKGDDFHPYAIAPAAYWTGFYTSRGGLKRHIKQAGQILQSCKQMAIFTDLEGSPEQVNVLRDAMGVMQHHDAVTGTQRYHVLRDYNRILSEATSVCQKVMSLAYKKSWQIPATDPLTPQFCFGLNMSSCHVTEGNDEFFVSVYNPLSWSFDVDVRFPVTGSDWIIKDHQENEIQYQMVPIHEHILRIPERETNKADAEIILLPRLPAMSATTFRVRKTAGEASKFMYETIPQNTDFVIVNEHLSLVFNPQSGLLVAITNLDMSITQTISQEFRYYEAEQNTNRPSGVYLFTPKSNVTIPVGDNKVDLKYIKGPLVQEVHQTFSPWVSQVIRLYKGAKHVELQWTVGPIDDGGFQGKEVISIYTTNIASDDTFYTDSNGREVIQRVKDEKEGSNLQPKDHVSGNYYPVTSRIYIKDTKKDVQLSVLTDRPQGGSSLKSGTVELMVHRRVMRDDDLGLAEGLQDNGADGKGIVYTGKHYLVLDTKENSASVIKRMALQVHLAPTVMFTPFVSENQLKSRPRQETFLASVLPENIHILTLDRIHFNETNLYLLRIEHLYEENELRGLSAPTELSLQALFKPFEIVSIVETSLGGNLIPDDVKRLRWHTFNDVTSEKIGSTDYQRYMEPPFTIVIRPMEIRTFNIFVSRKSV